MPPRLLSLLAAGGLMVVCLATIPALELGPALFSVQRIPPGKAVDIAALGGPRFTIPNKGKQEQTYTLTCQSPSPSALAGWERGYEAIPDASWCTLESEEITVPAGGEKQIGMTINIPDRPENYNRKWLVGVVLKPGGKKGIGVGLAVAARVQIETTVSSDAGHWGGPLALLPGLVALSGRPGETVHGSTRLRNTGAKEMPCRFDRLVNLYPDPYKHPRYTSNGWKGIVTETWLEDLGAPFTLAPAAERSIDLVGHIPKDAAAGTRWEELVFIRSLDPAVPEAERLDKEVLTFLRVQFTVSPPTP